MYLLWQLPEIIGRPGFSQLSTTLIDQVVTVPIQGSLESAEGEIEQEAPFADRWDRSPLHFLFNELRLFGPFLLENSPVWKIHFIQCSRTKQQSSESAPPPACTLPSLCCRCIPVPTIQPGLTEIYGNLRSRAVEKL